MSRKRLFDDPVPTGQVPLTRSPASDTSELRVGTQVFQQAQAQASAEIPDGTALRHRPVLRLELHPGTVEDVGILSIRHDPWRWTWGEPQADCLKLKRQIHSKQQT